MKFQSVHKYLSIKNDIILFQDKIVIPRALRKEMITLAHEGHQGIVRTKQRLRTKVWWPRLSHDVEKFIQHCHPCQTVEPLQKPTPLRMTSLPKEPWLLLGCDLCGPFPTGENLLVCVDYYSRYPEVEILHKTTSPVIVMKLRKLFCRYGAPAEIITDNGPQFISKEFDSLMSEFNIKHRKVEPYHLQSNGEVERFNRTLKKAIQTAIAEGSNWRITLDNFLLNYRNTPHATTGVPPSQLLFGRKLRDKLPSATNHKKPKKKLASKDEHNKSKIKELADLRNKARPHNIGEGMLVLVANTSKHRTKYESQWLHDPAKVIRIKGNSVLMERKGKEFMRNSIHVKPYRQPSPLTNIRENKQTTPTKPSHFGDSDSDDDDDDGMYEPEVPPNLPQEGAANEDLMPAAAVEIVENDVENTIQPSNDSNIALSDGTDSDSTIPFNQSDSSDDDNDNRHIGYDFRLNRGQKPGYLNDYVTN